MTAPTHSPSNNGIESSLKEVADGVFAYLQPDGSWFLNNCGFVSVPDQRDILAIDASSTEARTRRFIETIHERTGGQATVLVNTHHHVDHTHGNYLFEQTPIIGHRLCREEMLKLSPPTDFKHFSSVEWGDIQIAPPTMTFNNSMSVHVGDLACVVEYVGTPAHTTNDSVVWIPERSVLFCGDLLFNGGTPFFLSGSIAGMLEAMTKLRTYKAQTIVTGHGPVADDSLIDRVESYVKFVAQAATEGKANNLSPLELARHLDLGEFAELGDSERIVGNLHRAYAELDGELPGARINETAALDDMLAYNGGNPLTCFA